jgi:hypothetical protein
MKGQCTPQLVNEAHQKCRSWRKAAKELNACFGVDLSHTAWHDYAAGRRDIADPETRTALGLAPRLCPNCAKEADSKITRLLKRLTEDDRQYWQELYRSKKFEEAERFLEEVSSREIK